MINNKKKQVAFITGISDGIGKSLAIKLNYCGYKVMGISRNKPDYIEDNKNIIWFEFDLKKKFDSVNFLAEFHKYSHKVDIIIFNAATAYYEKIIDISEQHFYETLQVNLLSSIFIFKNLLPIMKKNSQTIFVGSSTEYLPSPNMGLYGMLKAAQSHMVKTLSVECMPHRIIFKEVKPGFVKTNFAQKTGCPQKNLDEKLAISSDYVADDIIKLIQSNKYQIHSGILSKCLYLAYKISPRIGLLWSRRRYGKEN